MSPGVWLTRVAPLVAAGALGYVVSSEQGRMRARDEMLALRLRRLEHANSAAGQRTTATVTRSLRRSRITARKAAVDASLADRQQHEDVQAQLAGISNALESMRTWRERDNNQLVQSIADSHARLQLQVTGLGYQIHRQDTKVRALLNGYALHLTTIRKDLAAVEAGEHGGSLRKRLVADVAALFAMHAEGSRSALPVPSGWSMTPRVLEYLLRTIRMQHRVDTVVELGSGASTPWLASALAGRPMGRLICFEHDDHFATLVAQQLEAAELTSCVEVRCRPLAPVQVGDESYQWYQDFGDMADIDLLIVDGPPGATGPRARYPALPLLLGMMRDGGLVVLDDANRDDEMSIIDRWLTLSDDRRHVQLLEWVDRAAVFRIGHRRD